MQHSDWLYAVMKIPKCIRFDRTPNKTKQKKMASILPVTVYLFTGLSNLGINLLKCTQLAVISLCQAEIVQVCIDIKMDLRGDHISQTDSNNGVNKCCVVAIMYK